MSLSVPFLHGIDTGSALDDVSLLLNAQPRETLAYAPWPDYPYHPEVRFSIAYGYDALFIKYYVKEKNIRAVHNTLNAPVYQDSCVEFFIGFGNEPAYYNFEFNCIGTHLAGYGEDKQSRQVLPVQATQPIRYKAIVSNDHNSDKINWELTLLIPFASFYYHTLTSLKGKKCRANFYKCGDELPEPHFIAWKDIQWPQPNFHLQQFFGTLCFE